MANWSAFTMGGIDPIATNWERHNARKDAKASQEMQQSYDIWRADTLPTVTLRQQNRDYWMEQNLAYQRSLDSVSNYRAALENAGFNPLLAVGAGGGLGAAPGSGSQPLVSSNSASRINSSFSGGSSGMGGNPYDIANARQELHNRQKQNELLDAQIDQIEAQVRHLNATTAQTEKETEYIGSSNFSKLMQTIYQNRFEKYDDTSVSPLAKPGSLGDTLYQFKTWMQDKLDEFSRQSLPAKERTPERKEERKEEIRKSLERNFVLPF